MEHGARGKGCGACEVIGLLGFFVKNLLDKTLILFA